MSTPMHVRKGNSWIRVMNVLFVRQRKYNTLLIGIVPDYHKGSILEKKIISLSLGLEYTSHIQQVEATINEFFIYIVLCPCSVGDYMHGLALPRESLLIFSLKIMFMYC